MKAKVCNGICVKRVVEKSQKYIFYKYFEFYEALILKIYFL